MKIKIKPNSYYKRYYDDHYTIWYTDNKHSYIMAYKYKNKPLEKLDNSLQRFTIDTWEWYINTNKFKTEEISKEDLFLELL